MLTLKVTEMAGIRYIAHCPCGHENRAFGFGVASPLLCPVCGKQTLVVDAEVLDDDLMPHPKGSNGDRATHPRRQGEK